MWFRKRQHSKTAPAIGAGTIKLPAQWLGNSKSKSARSRKSAWQVKFRQLRNFGVGEEKYFFVENMAMLLTSGMDLLSALDAIRAEVRTKRMQQVIDDLKADATAGLPIWRSLHRQYLLKPYVVALIRIGEEAGRLVDNLQVIVTQQQKDSVFRAKLRAAMTYPILVLSIAFIIGLGLAVFILPRLATVFGSLNIELPLITRILLAFGAFMKVYGYVVTPIFIVVFFTALYFVFFAPQTKRAGQALLFSLPGIKRLIREVELARMGYVFGTLLQAGMPIVEAIHSLRDATGFYKYKSLYHYLAQQVNVGESLRTALTAYKNSRKLIPRPIQQMIIAGEQSGRLPAALLQVGKMYEEKTEATAKNLTTVLEPLLLLIVWAGVAAVALAVIMPIYGLIGNLNQARTGGPKPTTIAVTPTPLPTITATPTVEPVVEATKVRALPTVGGRINVRSAPALTATVLTTIEPGAEYIFNDERVNEEGEPQWYYIVIYNTANGEEGEEIGGWVAAALVEVVEGGNANAAQADN